MNYFDMKQDDAELLALLKRIRNAVKAARPGQELDEFVIMRQLPRVPGKPFVQLIEGVVPKGFDFYQIPRPGFIRKHQTTTKKKSKLRKRMNKQHPA